MTLVIAAAMLVMGSCQRKPVMAHARFVHLPTDGWQRTLPLTFRPEYDDSAATYDITLAVRYDNSYRYRNLTMAVDVITADSAVNRRTVDMALAVKPYLEHIGRKPESEEVILLGYSQGGSTILTEVPEMFGAEHLLMRRAISDEVLQDTIHLINDFKEYYLSHGQPVGENPSPGNKAGGISTLEEKALGCTQKSGTSPVVGVLKYGERLSSTRAGLHLLSAPGNDLVASTALAAAGCQLVLFTTGRGTPFSTFAPTLKVSTNSELARRKPQWIDFNAGVLLDDVTMDKLLQQFTLYVIDVASGRSRTTAELHGNAEFAIFKTGVTL